MSYLCIFLAFDYADIKNKSALIHITGLRGFEGNFLFFLVSRLYQTTLTGSVLAEVTVSSSCVYSVACQDAPARFLAAAGASNRIDICAPNFSYKDQTIEFPLN